MYVCMHVYKYIYIYTYIYIYIYPNHNLGGPFRGSFFGEGRGANLHHRLKLV